MGYTVAVLGAPRWASKGCRDWADEVAASLVARGHDARVTRGSADLAADLAAARPDACIVAFEDRGRCARAIADLAGVPCPGPGQAELRLLHDKAALADLLASARSDGFMDAGMPGSFLVGARYVGAQGTEDLVRDYIERSLPGGFPVSVAPVDAPLSDALLVEGPSALRGAMASFSGRDLIVREHVDGVRATVFVVNDGQDVFPLPAALPQTEPDGSTTWQVPLPLEALHARDGQGESIRSEIERSALEACLAIGCSGVVRVDLAWDGAQARLLDVDAPCSLAEGGPLRRALLAAGIDPADLLDAAVRDAVAGGAPMPR